MTHPTNPLPAIDQAREQMLQQLPKCWPEDHGIGPYEFWGQKGIDRQIVLAHDDNSTNRIEITLPEDETFNSFIREFIDLSFDLEDAEADLAKEIYPKITLVIYPSASSTSAVSARANLITLAYRWIDDRKS